jgi:hypothetical protein
MATTEEERGLGILLTSDSYRNQSYDRYDQQGWEPSHRLHSGKKGE